MQITFNTNDLNECRNAASFIMRRHPSLRATNWDATSGPGDAFEAQTGIPAAPTIEMHGITSAEQAAAVATGQLPAAPAPVADPGVELDSTGTPWLEAVHTGTKSKGKDGRWNKKRNVTKEEREAAEAAARAELVATPAAAVPVAAAPGLVPGAPPQALPVAAQSTPLAATLEQVVAAFKECERLSLIDGPGMQALYAQYGTSGVDIETNDTARAGVYAALQSILQTASTVLTPSSGLPA